MSKKESAIIIIQSAVRDWLCRKALIRKSKCLEFRLKNILPNRKPPVYRKKSNLRNKSYIEQKVLMVQKNFRGYLQRKRYKELIIEKMLKEQEDLYQRKIEKIEKELCNPEESPKSTNANSAVKANRSNSLYLELPLSMAQKRIPSKQKKIQRSVVYEYDYYISAAIQIQKVFRGFFIRQRFGDFKKIRRRIISFQRIYRDWRQKKEGQLELAATLMNKQCSMLTTSFSSYQHLKSLILTQDRQGKYTKFITHCENRVKDAGVSNSQCINKYLEERIKELEFEKAEQENYYREALAGTKAKYKGIVSEYLKGVKALKFGLEIAQKNNFELVSKLVRNLAEGSRDLESESYYEVSTFLPDVSFIDNR